MHLAKPSSTDRCLSKILFSVLKQVALNVHSLIEDCQFNPKVFGIKRWLSFNLKRPISSEPNARWRIAALIAASTAAYTDVVQAEKEDSSFCHLNCKYTLGKACNEDIETMVNFGHARMKTLCISDKGIEVCKRLIGNSSAAVEVTKGRFHLWLNTKYNQFLSSHKLSANDCKEDSGNM